MRIVACLVCLLLGAASALGDSPVRLPSPLELEDVRRYAALHRPEIEAARARALAAAQRPAMAAAPEDPMIMPSIDHAPFMLDGVDASLMIEQRLGPPGLRRARHGAAEARARLAGADVGRVGLDVQLEAATAFVMLHERREMARLTGEQLALARQLVDVTTARHAAGSGQLADVRRAELEVARLEGARRTLHADILAAEAMLATSLGLPPDTPIPALTMTAELRAPPSWPDVRRRVLRDRPELAAGRAEIAAARAEVDAMEAMGRPMLVIRTGPAYTMAEHWGWMLTVGVSVPLWRAGVRAGVREATAMTAMARADLRAMSRMAQGEAAAARAGVLAARERVLSLRDDVLPRARLALEPALGGYAAGTLPLLAVLEVAQTLWAIEMELIEAEMNLGLAWARLHRALGDPAPGAER
jgi:outer membrane protein TolC